MLPSSYLPHSGIFLASLAVDHLPLSTSCVPHLNACDPGIVIQNPSSSILAFDLFVDGCGLPGPSTTGVLLSIALSPLQPIVGPYPFLVAASPYLLSTGQLIVDSSGASFQFFVSLPPLPSSALVL